MTTKRTYECNLCRQGIDSEEALTLRRHGIGIYWGSGQAGNEVIELRPLYQAENHLCDVCIAQLLRVLPTYKRE